jgi:hypothetical protein
VRNRDGSTEPFEPDRINRSLFAASERVGRPDAFLARELTDSVLHFLAQECEGGTVSIEQITDTLVKVIRELGQPQLAAACAAGNHPPSTTTSVERRPPVVDSRWPTAESRNPLALQRRLASETLTAFSLEHVFARTLTAARAEGLLTLGGLETPFELDAAVIRPASAGGGLTWASGVFEVMEQTRSYVGRAVAVDSPERDFIQRGARIGDAAVWIKELSRAARTLGLQVVLNLGSASLPPWAAGAPSGPLFVEQAKPDSSQGLLAFLDALIDHVLHLGVQSWLRIDWHLTERDFEEAGEPRLTRLLRAALSGLPITFVCQRAKREVSLAEGLDRNHQATLLWVGLHLPTLLARHRNSLEPETFIAKTLILARLAASAGVQKRDFLRRHARPDRPAFLLERAHLAVHLIGLRDVLRQMFQGAASAELHFTQELCKRLTTTLAEEARHTHLKSLIDDPMDVAPEEVESHEDADGFEMIMKQAGKRHAAMGRGTLTLGLHHDELQQPRRLLELLKQAQHQASINRVRFVRQIARQTQLTMPSADEPVTKPRGESSSLAELGRSS